MKIATRVALFLGLAGGLLAQGTLSFGEITLNTPITNPPSYTVDIILTSGNTAAGAQFDLNYLSQLNVVVNLGAAATAAGAQISTATTPTANNPWCPNGEVPCAQPNDSLAGQRVIIIGCSIALSGSCSPTVQGANPTANAIQDGVVATLTVTPTGTPSTTNEILAIPNIYIAATTQGSNTVAAAAIPLTITGATDGASPANGKLNLNGIYLVGGVYPQTSTTAPNFGSGSLVLNDLIAELFAVNKIPGSTPACGSDLFDAMDTFPLDTATTRGGLRNGTLTLNDLIAEIFKVNKIPGYTTLPMRTSSPYVCASNVNPGAAGITAQARTRTPPEVQGSIVVGAAQGAGAGQDRVPVYLQASRNLGRVGVTFGMGDQKSPLRFDASVKPSLLEEGTTGIVAAAWIQGFDVRAGEQLLLGYITGPTGFASNLKVFGASASGVDDFREVGLNVSGATVVNQ